jgi:heme o synthase
MTFSTGALDLALAGGYRKAADFGELTKPRITVMVLVTTFVGFYLGSGSIPDYFRLIQTLIGTAFAAGGTLALNQFLERDADAVMERTRHRPLPEGRVQPAEALVFGVALTVSGLVTLWLVVNALSALVTATIVISYLFVYTPLKQKTSLCSVVGAIPGALPPVIGWTAARGELEAGAWALFAIMFLWQIPHTLAIARLYREDFARAGIRFLPVIEPDGASTGRQVLTNCAALLAVSLVPTFLQVTGYVYFLAAFFLGAVFLGSGLGLVRSQSSAAARRLLFVSLIYLPVLLAVMALDRIPL